MRLFGLFLLVFGAALCASVVWAALGFLAMALGLICIQIRTRPLFLPGDASASGEPAFVLSEPTIASSTRASTHAVGLEGRAPREGLVWNALADQDEELADVERLLSRYGAAYADQFRRLYCIFNSKELLPSIVSLVVEAAKYESGACAPHTSPGSQKHSGDGPESLRVEQPAPAANVSAASSPSGNVASSPFNPPRNDAPSDVAESARAAIDPEDITNFTNIFDQLSRSRG